MTAWDGAVVLRTERLVVRRWRLDDLDAWEAFNADPLVYGALGGAPLPRDACDAMAAWHNDLHAHEGIGLLALERTADGAFLGMCGLHHQETFPDDVEIAWRLASEHWGHGYATEAATSWLDHAFGPLALDRVLSLTDRDNARSLAVMRRLGMSHVGDAVVRDGDEVFDALVHEVTAASWRVVRQGGRRG